MKKKISKKPKPAKRAAKKSTAKVKRKKNNVRERRAADKQKTDELRQKKEPATVYDYGVENGKRPPVSE